MASDPLVNVTKGPLSATDWAFLPVAVVNNRFEIEASTLAKTLGRSGEVQSYAQDMIEVHTRRLAALQAAALNTDPVLILPAGVSPEQQRQLVALKSAGPAFDALYQQNMEAIHAQTYQLFDTFVHSATANAGLRQLVQAALPTVRMHWDMARQLPGGAK
jgi:putative membrane protein